MGCLVFGNDRATSKEARTPDDMVAEAAEVVASGFDSSGMGDMPIQQSSGLKRSRSDVPKVSSSRRRRQTVETNPHVGDSMIRATQIMADQLDKTEIMISKAILDLKET
ncbi:hypothetical protein Scep_010413 [Stephania cephalantha]|uniref:Uncharacterized protein n=1 Tax=Stephania cephalantha TaxID=152367 RepID=A0AAP0JXF9_9MAGN